LDAKRLDSTNPPTGDTYGDKIVGYLRWQPDTSQSTHSYWAEYRFRYNGSTDANLDPDAPVPPVGKTLPSFLVHTVSAGVRLAGNGRFSHEIRVAIENVTNELYSEFSNATFFRPEPGRSYDASYRLRF